MNMLYGYTNFSEINLDYVIKLVRENAGLHLEISGNQLLLKTLDNTVISSVTIHYAEEAGHADTATNAINATYATSANSANSATNATNAGHALTADSATTAGTATTATTATTAGTATEATHATTADTALTANNATHATNADYATTTGSVEHALNAFEGVSANGLKTRFTRGDGTSVDFDVPSAIKADKDTQNNQISTTYIATVEDVNGTLLFKNAIGTTLFSITPSSQTATEDSYGNTIADFIKTITAPSDSNYITVNHGTGLTDTLTVNYANKAWKDTNGNVIKNFYIGSLEIVKDSDTDHYNLVCYNGDTPRAELFRVEVNAYTAQEAEEANHASTADYATNAGHALTADSATTADTATTSTGSVSSISSPSGNKQYIQINNGDGTTTKFNIPLWKIQFEFIEDVSQINIFDNAFTVGHAEEYEINSSDLTKYGYTDALDILEEGTYIELLSNGNEVMFNTPIMSNKNSDGGYIIIVLNPYTVTLEVFNIKPGSDDQHIKLTRLL